MASSTRRAEFLVRGMDCAEEIATLRGELTGFAGVRDLSFDLAGRAALWTAIAADTGASLLVVLHALRLLKPGHSPR